MRPYRVVPWCCRPYAGAAHGPADTVRPAALPGVVVDLAELFCD
ncbi:MAG: hypothetical protein AVDCRST_MAG49-2627 [uncultured Thermomicrobiales bacterium]|uniref:Uncharacterized protein n=1 Tax=uncultured Thermomicrobiales bacterium TaxID=1645740 RepID=A0A6J4UWK3_9BACT|nr:MAG: hypothetical protein AVDCRST_MAG49-2627 [uncultured Thermomicrobiales bacterium]